MSKGTIFSDGDKSIRKNFVCECGSNHISLQFKHSMPSDVVDRVFCPECEIKGFKSGKSWPIPGGWYLHFDVEVARMFAMAKLGIDPGLVNPGFIFDNGYVD